MCIPSLIENVTDAARETPCVMNDKKEAKAKTSGKVSRQPPLMSVAHYAVA